MSSHTGRAAIAYDRWYDTPLGAGCLNRELGLLRQTRAFSDAARVLEVGCGTGRFLTSVPCDRRASAGVDRDLSRLELARDRAQELGLPLAWIMSEAHALPFPDSAFDIVFEGTLLCFVGDAEGVIREMVRVCRTGGHIILGELSPTSLWQWWRRARARFGRGSFVGARFHRPGDLAKLLEGTGCGIERMERAIFFPPVRLRRALLDALDRLGRLVWPWAGAFYVIHATKETPD